MTATTLLTETQVADQLGIRPGLLREWRYLDSKDNGHRGPAFIKLGRLVRYQPAAVDAWLRARPAG